MCKHTRILNKQLRLLELTKATQEHSSCQALDLEFAFPGLGYLWGLRVCLEHGMGSVTQSTHGNEDRTPRASFCPDLHSWISRAGQIPLSPHCHQCLPVRNQRRSTGGSYTAPILAYLTDPPGDLLTAFIHLTVPTLVSPSGLKKNLAQLS